LIVPNTVALVEGAPHAEQGKALVDHLLAESTTAALVESGWFQVTLRPIPTDSACLDAEGVRGMNVPLGEIGSHISEVTAELSDLFIAP
jgi:ABC-type Fe3+ transport system substrate-binding protein